MATQCRQQRHSKFLRLCPLAKPLPSYHASERFVLLVLPLAKVNIQTSQVDERQEMFARKAAAEKSLVSALVPQERRSYPHYPTATSVLACPFDPEYKEEVETISNASRDGLYFQSHSTHYRPGMAVTVIVGYRRNNPANSPILGKVIRVDHLDDRTFGVALRILKL